MKVNGLGVRNMDMVKIPTLMAVFISDNTMMANLMVQVNTSGKMDLTTKASLGMA